MEPQAFSCRVLVVDENEDSTTGLSELLSLWGHEISTAYDGTHALALALHRPQAEVKKVLFSWRRA